MLPRMHQKQKRRPKKQLRGKIRIQPKEIPRRPARTIAVMLDGMQYPKEKEDIWKAAEENGYTVVFGHSDDSVEFRSAVDGEFWVSSGGTVGNGLPGDICATAVWCGKVNGEKVYILSEFTDKARNIIPWTYKANVPCEEFMIYEGASLFCMGIVFSADSTQKIIPEERKLQEASSAEREKEVKINEENISFEDKKR